MICMYTNEQQTSRMPRVKHLSAVYFVLDKLQIPVEANETTQKVGWMGMYCNYCGQKTSGLPPDQPPVS